MARKKKIIIDPIKMKGSDIDKLLSEEDERMIRELIPFNFLEEYVNLIFNKKIRLSPSNIYNETINTDKIEKMINRIKDHEMQQVFHEMCWEQKINRSLADEYTLNQVLLDNSTPFKMIERKYLNRNINTLIQLKLLAFLALNFYFPDTIQLRQGTGESNFFKSNYRSDFESTEFKKARIANIENKVIEPLRNNIKKFFSTNRGDSKLPIIRISTLEVQNSIIHYIIRISSDLSPISKHLMIVENTTNPNNPNLYLISDEELGFSNNPSGDLLDYYILQNKVLPIRQYPAGLEKEDVLKYYLENVVYEYIDSLFDLEKNFIVYKFQQTVANKVKGYEEKDYWKGLSKVETSIVERVNNIDIPLTIKLEKVLDNYNINKANKNYYINIIPSALKYFSTLCIVSTNPELVLFDKWNQERKNIQTLPKISPEERGNDMYYTFFLPIEGFMKLKIDILSKAQKQYLFNKKTRESEKYKNIPDLAFETETVTSLIGRIIPRNTDNADEKYMSGQVKFLERSEEDEKDLAERPLHHLADDLLQKIYFDYKRYIIEKAR